LWLGYALECGGDPETALTLYQQAHSGMRNIPPVRLQTSVSNLPSQAITVAREFELAGAHVRTPRTFDRDLLYLSGTGTTNQTEEALRCLGQYLGFQSTRPDKEHGTGPDVLWICPDYTAFCFELKNDKEPSSVYRKSELGQLADHIQWVRDNIEVERIVPAFIGPEVGTSETANPAPGVKVAALDKFEVVGEILKNVYRDIAANSLPLTIAPIVVEQFENRALNWPELETALGLVELRDLTSAPGG
jgi:hypothetical protein